MSYGVSNVISCLRPRTSRVWQPDSVLTSNETNIHAQWKDSIRKAKNLGSHVFYDHLNDITVVSKDGEEISCHRLVLSLRSNVFNEIIKSGNVTDGKIHVGEFDASTVRKMIDFLYTDSIEWKDGEFNIDLLAMALKYEVEEFKRIVAVRKPKITLQNVIEFWSKASLYSQHEEMLSECGAFIQQNWDAFKDTEEFLALMEHDKQAAMKLMVDVIGNSYDKIQIGNEKSFKKDSKDTKRLDSDQTSDGSSSS